MNVLLRREGWDVNIKRTHRIYNELGLQLLVPVFSGSGMRPSLKDARDHV
jgi:hypothetical protein